MAEVIQINESTWRIEDGMVRFFLFAGTEKAALIDSGMTTANAKEIAEGLTSLPIILINTHADGDHVAGNGEFDEFYMSPDEEENYREHGGMGNVLPIKEGDIIDLGDRPLRIIDIPGHTPGSIAILDEKNRVLVSGDTVQDGTIFMFGKFRNIDIFLESLKHLSKYDGMYDEIYPMHGTFPVRQELIGKLIEGAEEIRTGKASGENEKVFGNEVIHYQFSYAGFFCDVK